MSFPSEARRSNSFIKTPKQFGETLQYLINDKGAKSELFPKSVKELLELDGQLNVCALAYQRVTHQDHRHESCRTSEGFWHGGP